MPGHDYPLTDEELARIKEHQAATHQGIRDAALEEAAKACEALMTFNEDDPGASAAAAIRALKD